MSNRLLSWVGIVSLLVGTLLASHQLKNIGALPDAIIGWLPGILIALGLVRLLQVLRINRTALGSVILVMLGLGILMFQHNATLRDHYQRYGPGILMIAGVALILSASAASSRLRTTPDIISFALFQRKTVSIASKGLRRVTGIVFLSDLQLDFRQSSPDSGGIDVQSWIIGGHLDIILPMNWPYSHRVRVCLPRRASFVRDLSPEPEGAMVRINEAYVFGDSSIEGGKPAPLKSA